MNAPLKPPPLKGGLKYQFFGVILAVLALINIIATYFTYHRVDGIDLFFIVAGGCVFIYGAVQKKKKNHQKL